MITTVEELRGCLDRCELLRELSIDRCRSLVEDRQALLATATTKGQFVWHVGTPPKHVAVVVDGEVEIRRKETAVFRYFTPGNLLGLSALIGEGGKPHTADVVTCPGITSVLYLPAEPLRTWVQQDVRFANEILAHMRDLIVRLTDKNELLRLRAADERVCGQMQILARDSEDGGVEITRDRLAALVGMHVDVVGRALTHLKTEGVIARVERNPSRYYLDAAKVRDFYGFDPSTGE